VLSVLCASGVLHVRWVGLCVESSRYLLFRPSHSGTVVGRLLAHYRISSQGWRNILSATSCPLLSITSSARNCFTAVNNVAI